MDDPRISELFAEMANWMGRIGVTDASKGPQPWRGQIETDRDTINVTLNASGAPVDCDDTELAPYTARVRYYGANATSRNSGPSPHLTGRPVR